METTKMADKKDFALSSYPMGPSVRRWLGVSEDQYTGRQKDKVTNEEKILFTKIVSRDLGGRPFKDEQEFLDVSAELFSMDVPLACLKLFDYYRDRWLPTDFHREQLEAVSALSAGELTRAWHASVAAHKHNPDEPAPYVNISRIFMNWGEHEQAKEWCHRGLQKFPDHRPLWQLVSSLYWVLYEDKDLLLEKLEALVQSCHSWIGSTLVAQYRREFLGDEQYKLKKLEQFYAEGERSEEFLLEFTGELGEAELYDRVPQIVAQAEYVTKDSMGWKLLLHSIQAYAALGDRESFDAQCERLKKIEGVPQGVLQELPSVWGEEQTH